mmetsp:Transcript_17734/g.30019  ORF Transcript_17734/g.30019 Transcript_17734/m.30019 type:complete len:243 (+) Transcript_17734:1295-2023(+)
MVANPLQTALGTEVGQMMANEHHKNGVHLHMDVGVKRITMNSNREVEGVILSTGEKILADMIIVGVGVQPSTDFLSRTETGIKLDKQGAVECDPFLQSSVNGIFAAGDNCSFPFWMDGKQTRIEHWVNAQEQGSYAAMNMMNKFVPYGNAPFFWTRHYNKSIQYIGNCKSYSEVFVQGEVKHHDFLAYYIDQGRICGVSGQGRNNEILALYEAMNKNLMPTPAQVKLGAETPETLAKKLKQY